MFRNCYFYFTLACMTKSKRMTSQAYRETVFDRYNDGYNDCNKHISSNFYKYKMRLSPRWQYIWSDLDHNYITLRDEYMSRRETDPYEIWFRTQLFVLLFELTLLSPQYQHHVFRGNTIYYYVFLFHFISYYCGSVFRVHHVYTGCNLKHFTVYRYWFISFWVHK